MKAAWKRPLTTNLQTYCECHVHTRGLGRIVDSYVLPGGIAYRTDGQNEEKKRRLILPHNNAFCKLSWAWVGIALHTQETKTKRKETHTHRRTQGPGAFRMWTETRTWTMEASMTGHPKNQRHSSRGLPLRDYIILKQSPSEKLPL